MCVCVSGVRGFFCAWLFIKWKNNLGKAAHWKIIIGRTDKFIHTPITKHYANLQRNLEKRRGTKGKCHEFGIADGLRAELLCQQFHWQLIQNSGSSNVICVSGTLAVYNK